MAISWNKIQRRNPRTDAKTWYPQISLNTTVTVDEVILGIQEKCTLHKVDIKAVLIALEDVVIEQLKMGNSVRFGTLGSFRPSLKTRAWIEAKKRWGHGGCPAPTTAYKDDGTVMAQGVTADNIAGIKVVFSHSAEMRRKLQRGNLQFRMVEGEIECKD